jgi:hypothetical protein
VLGKQSLAVNELLALLNDPRPTENWNNSQIFTSYALREA